MQSIENKITSRIYGHGRGWCFTPRSFQDIGSAEAVRIALFRLKKKGVIRQLASGLYDYPQFHEKMGLLSPDPMKIATALSTKASTRLQPAGALAANILGLSDQVPAKIVFLTDGKTQQIKIGRQDILFKKASPRNLSAAGKKSGLVIQALHHIGMENITRHQIRILRKALTNEEKAQLKKDRIYAPIWMHKFLREIEGNENV
jgi:hypothetical protein